IATLVLSGCTSTEQTVTKDDYGDYRIESREEIDPGTNWLLSSIYRWYALNDQATRFGPPTTDSIED
ncbi:MAG: hypothetical protein ACQKBU_11285, partial [Verrucomicrobiales bacterium]